jgi:putative cell wall-binding protein
MVTAALILGLAIVPLPATAATGTPPVPAPGGAVIGVDKAAKPGVSLMGAPIPLADSALPDAYEPDGHWDNYPPLGTGVPWGNVRELNGHLPRSLGNPVWGKEPYTEVHTIDIANTTQWDEDWFELTVPAGDYTSFSNLSYMVDAFSQDPNVDTVVDVYGSGIQYPKADAIHGADDTTAAASSDDSPWEYRSASASFVPHVRPGASGHYWIRVRPYWHGLPSGFSGHAGTYTLRIKVGQAMRLFGQTRIDTAVSISQEGWPTYPVASRNTTVVVAYGYDFPDALAAGSLAGVCGSPILLTSGTSLPAQVRDEIKRLGVKGVYVIGGPTRITDAVVNQIRQISSSINVERVAGTDRVGTAIKVMQKVKLLSGPFFPHTALIAYGWNYPDALALSPVSAARQAPIFLSHKEALDVSVRGAIAANGFTDVIIAGGTPALSAQIENDLVNLGVPSNRILRLGGENRYETAKLIASWACDLSGPGPRGDNWIGTVNNPTALARLWNPTLNVYATGENYADALAAGAFAGKASAPILLTPKASVSPYLFGHPGSIPAGKTTWFQDLASIPHMTPIGRSYVVGGSAAITDATFQEIDMHTGMPGS